MSIQFDDENQKKSLNEIREKEEEDLVEMIAEAKYGIPPINLTGLKIDNNALTTVPENDAMEMEIAPFKLVGRNIHVAVRSPQPEKLANLTTYFSEHEFTPHFYMASLSSLKKAWGRYEEISSASESKVWTISIPGDTLKKIAERIKNIEDIKKEIGEIEKDKSHTTSHILEIVLAGAISINAS